jgi:hypothetical protein
LPFTSAACTESLCLPELIVIALRMIDPEAVPTFTRSKKIVNPDILELLTAVPR